MELLKVENLSLRYETRTADIRALSDISFSVNPGERLGIVGESGSGKSSLGSAILGLITFPGKITGGRVLFEGKDIADMSEKELEGMRGEGATMIFQDSRASPQNVFRRLPLEYDFARRKSFKMQNCSAKSCLAASGFADNPEGLPSFQAKAYSVYRFKHLASACKLPFLYFKRNSQIFYRKNARHDSSLYIKETSDFLIFSYP